MCGSGSACTGGAAVRRSTHPGQRGGQWGGPPLRPPLTEAGRGEGARGTASTRWFCQQVPKGGVCGERERGRGVCVRVCLPEGFGCFAKREWMTQGLILWGIWAVQGAAPSRPLFSQLRASAHHRVGSPGGIFRRLCAFKLVYAANYHRREGPGCRESWCGAGAQPQGCCSGPGVFWEWLIGSDERSTAAPSRGMSPSEPSLPPLKVHTACCLPRWPTDPS